MSLKSSQESCHFSSSQLAGYPKSGVQNAFLLVHYNIWTQSHVCIPIYGLKATLTLLLLFSYTDSKICPHFFKYTQSRSAVSPPKL